MFQNTKALILLVGGVIVAVVGAVMLLIGGPSETEETPTLAVAEERPADEADETPEADATDRRQTALTDINLALATTASRIGLACRLAGGQVVSGTGGAPLCDRGEETWPVLDMCGGEGVRFVVKGGDTDAWDFVIECAAYPECSGPKGALCNARGCTIAPVCQPTRS